MLWARKEDGGKKVSSSASVQKEEGLYLPQKMDVDEEEGGEMLKKIG